MAFGKKARLFYEYMTVFIEITLDSRDTPAGVVNILIEFERKNYVAINCVIFSR